MAMQQGPIDWRYRFHIFLAEKKEGDEIVIDYFMST